VRRGFLDIYPGQTVPAHLQNLVSGYATNRGLAYGSQSNNSLSRLFTLQGLNKAYQVLRVHANDAPTRAVNVRYGVECDA
jgi:hypothetical protein